MAITNMSEVTANELPVIHEKDGSPNWVLGPSAMMSPALTVSPTFTSGRWVMQVFWLLRWNFLSR